MSIDKRLKRQFQIYSLLPSPVPDEGYAGSDVDLTEDHPTHCCGSQYFWKLPNHEHYKYSVHFVLCILLTTHRHYGRGFSKTGRA